MQVVSVLCQKGGAGKTTLTLCLAVAAMREGREVVVVDLDPQSSASSWGDVRSASRPVVVSVHAPRLGAVLQAARDNGAQRVFIDTPPRASDISLAAAKVSDLVVLPCRPTSLDLQTVAATLQLLSLAQAVPVLCVLNAVSGSVSDAHSYLQTQTSPAFQLSTAMLRQRVAFDQAFSVGKTPQESAPSSKAAAEIAEVYAVVRDHLASLAPQEPS